MSDISSEPTRPQPVVTEGPVGDAIRSLDPRQATDREQRGQLRAAVAEVKARALADSTSGFIVTIARRQYVVSGIRYDRARNAVVCQVSDLPPGANPLVFVNPPVLVGDGALIKGEGGRTETLRADPAEAFRVLVGQHVEHVLGPDR